MKVALNVLFHVNKGDVDIQVEMAIRIMDRQIWDFIVI